MSIANEINRIVAAKNDLKEVIKNRGVQIGDNILLDEYASVVENFPFVLKGTFTPEEDVKSFGISGLGFVPCGVLMCSVDAYSATSGSIYATYLYKGEYGAVMYLVDKAIGFASVSPTSAIVQWGDSSVNLTIPATSTVLFKKGYTYNYIVLGGKV